MNQLSQKQNSMKCAPEIQPVVKNFQGEMCLVDGAETASYPAINLMVERLREAFPKMELGFWKALTVAIVRNGLTENDCKAVYVGVVDNCQYNTLTIAQVLKFRPKNRIYTRSEALEIVHEKNQSLLVMFERVMCGGKYYTLKG